MRSIVVRQTGPRVLGFQSDPTQVTGPGKPPPGFVSATTSASEWIVYWALAKAFRDPIDPRVSPYYGGRSWGYQINSSGGRHILGGAVVDFVVYLPGDVIGIRLQTQRFHQTAGPFVHAYDQNQLEELSRWMTIKDLYEEQVIGDPSGAKAVAAVIDLLGGRARINPVTSGTYYKVRA